MFEISIIIPVYNEEKYIYKCLESIAKQTYNCKKIEVIIVDGMSNDNTIKIIENFKINNNLEIKILENKKRFAPYAMNIGIKASSGDIIIRIDGHAYIDKQFIENCVNLLNNRKDIECVGGVIDTINENKIGNIIALAMSSPFGVGNAKFRYSNKECYVDTLAFGAYRKKIFNEIGLFDEELIRNQDDELNFRLIKSGKKILLSPSIKSTYYGRSSIIKLFKQYFQYGYWKVRVAQKHKKITSLRQLIPLLFVVSIISFLIAGLISKVFFYLLVLELIVYLMTSLIVSLVTLYKENNLKYIFALQFVFFTLHTSYGIGYLLGIYDFILRKKSGRFFNGNR